MGGVAVGCFLSGLVLGCLFVYLMSLVKRLRIKQDFEMQKLGQSVSENREET